MRFQQPINKDDTKTDLVPEGWYTVQIQPLEEKPTKNGDGSYLQGLAKIVGPTYANRSVFLRFTVTNPNADAVKIGRRQLGQLAQACGIDELQDTNQLINKKVDAMIRVRAGNANFQDTNEVSKWAPAGSQTATVSTPKPRVAPAANQAPDYGEIPF